MKLIRQSILYFAFFILVLSGGGIIFKLNRNLSTALLGIALVGILAICQRKLKPSLLNATTLISIGFIIFIGLNFIFGIEGQSVVKYGLFLVWSLIGILFAQFTFSYFSKEQFITLLRNILVVIMLHAFIGAILHLFVPFNQQINNPNIDYTADSFMYLFFVREDQYAFNVLGLNIVRNQGLFWEPGVLQFYLNLLLYIQFFIRKERNSIILLTILAIISTYSTTGLVILILQLLVYSWKAVRRNLIVLPFLIIGAGFIMPLFFANLSNKFVGDNSGSSSVRIYDFIQQISILIEYPFLGVGIDTELYGELRGDYNLLFEVSQDIAWFEGQEKGSSNSVMTLLVTLGVPMASLMLLGFIKSPFFTEKKILLSLIMIISVMTEPILTRPLFLFFIFSGIIHLYYTLAYSKKYTVWHLSRSSSRVGQVL